MYAILISNEAKLTSQQQTKERNKMENMTIVEQLVKEGKMKVNGAGYYFQNDKPWGFGILIQVNNSSNEKFINAIVDLADKTKKIITGEEQCPDGEDWSVDFILEQTEFMCKKRKLGGLSEFEDFQYELVISANIHCLTELQHPMTESDFTGSVYTYGS